jgi:hypothetical protein
MPATPMTVVESPFFLRKVAALLREDERSELITHLGMNPEAGAVVPGMSWRWENALGR